MENKAAQVEVKNLSKSFGNKTVFKNLHILVEPKEIYVLMGPSGSGKSVLLQHIIGLLKPDEGHVLINGMDTNNPQTHEKVRTAFIFQAGALFNSMTLFDNLAFYPREHHLKTEKEIQEQVEKLLETLGLQDAADTLPAQLSGGMRKRASIARALVMEPQVLLYDEPTSELDPARSAQISSIIYQLRQHFEVTSIVVSHDKTLALTIADKVALLQQGSILLEAPPTTFAKSQNPLVQNFLNPTIEL